MIIRPIACERNGWKSCERERSRKWARRDWLSVSGAGDHAVVIGLNRRLMISWLSSQTSPKTVKWERSARSLSSMNESLQITREYVLWQNELLFTNHNHITIFFMLCRLEFSLQCKMRNQNSRSYVVAAHRRSTSIRATIHAFHNPHFTAFILPWSNLSRLSTNFHQFGRRNVSSGVWFIGLLGDLERCKKTGHNLQKT